MSEQIIQMPDGIDWEYAVPFCKQLDDLPLSEKYTYDFSKTVKYRPFGMLLIAAKIRQFTTTHPDSKHFGKNFTSPFGKGHNYASHMGFFKSFYLDVGNEPGQAYGSDNYIPITELSVDKIREEANKNCLHIGDVLEKKARSLGNFLARDHERISDYLTYSIREVMRNVVEHSSADAIWFAGQYWPSYKRVEIAILDEGVGIKNSLDTNPKYRTDDDAKALALAVSPGITRTNLERRGYYDAWANSGYGLYVSSEISRMGGSFVICSGNCTLHLQDTGTYYISTSYKGTGVLMRINFENLERINDLCRKLVKKGQFESEEFTNTNNIASVASKSLKTRKSLDFDAF